jgi:hypothetical protein
MGKKETNQITIQKETKDIKITSPWLTKQELADYYKCSTRQIYDLKRERKIPYNKALRKYNVNDCDRALKRFEIKGVGDYQSFSE